MQCLTPIRIRNKDSVYVNDLRIVPCGRCYACLTNRRNAWTFRLLYESHKSISNYFLTLTYDDEHTDGNVYKETCQIWLKLFRYYLKDVKLKYYLVSEYGEQTFRPHYHVLVFFRKIVTIEQIQIALEKSWTRGNHYIGAVEQASIHYCTHHHITKGYTPDGLNKTFTLMSRNPAIAKDYIENVGPYHIGDISKSYVTFPGGQKLVLPRYLKEKLYTKEEQQQIANLCEPKAFVDEQKYFELNPTHTYSKYTKYVEMFKQNQLNKELKSKKHSL